jgi:hypothetical protein
MSIENDGGDVAMVCDECGDVGRAYHRTEFDEMVHHAKLKGWKITQNRKGGYTHVCPDCLNELAEFGIVNGVDS